MGVKHGLVVKVPYSQICVTPRFDSISCALLPILGRARVACGILVDGKTGPGVIPGSECLRTSEPQECAQMMLLCDSITLFIIVFYTIQISQRNTAEAKDLPKRLSSGPMHHVESC